jgi:hypothetical protein
LKGAFGYVDKKVWNMQADARKNPQFLKFYNSVIHYQCFKMIIPGLVGSGARPLGGMSQGFAGVAETDQIIDSPPNCRP